MMKIKEVKNIIKGGFLIQSYYKKVKCGKI